MMSEVSGVSEAVVATEGASSSSLAVELLEVFTVGLPFCAFKVLTGYSLVQHAPAWSALGVVLVALGALDVVVNAVNAIGLLVRRHRALEACTLSVATRVIRRRSRVASTWQELGTAVDVLLSMALVAVMIAAGFIGRLPESLLLVWNISVIVNVLGAGVARFGQSLHRHRLLRLGRRSPPGI
jgi:hypothetical protein